MTIDRKTLFAMIAAVALGYYLAPAAGKVPPSPANDRPVLRWIARAAKSLLWLSLVAEQPPAENPESRHLVHAPPVGEDGYQRIDHGQGW